jgi:Tfp pilus assembly protein FimV
MEEQSRAEFNGLEQACISKSHELREVEEQHARMTVEKEVLETDVQAAEDRCAQLQQRCAEVKGQLDELGETKACKEAELAAADSRLQSVQSLVLAENAKLLASQSAILCPVSRAASHRRIPLFRDWRAGWLTLLCFALARRDGRGAQSSRTRKARAEPGGRLSEDK